jgi:WD40 repeat protein
VTLDINEIATLTAHSTDILALAPDCTGELFASASRDRTIKLWSTAGEERATIQGHRGPVNDIAFSPDGSQMVSVSGDTYARIWAIPTAEGTTSASLLSSTLGAHHGPAEAVACSPDGATVAVGWNMWSFGHVTLWDLPTAQQITTRRMDHGQLVFGLAFSPDGTWLSIALAGGTIRIWDGESESGTIRGHGEAVRSVVYVPGGDLLASASSDHTIKLWTVPQVNPGGQLVATLKGHTEAVYDLAWSPDGQLLASASGDGSIRIWDIPSREAIAGLTMPHDVVKAVAWSPNGNLIAAAQNTIQVWSIFSS